MFERLHPFDTGHADWRGSYVFDNLQNDLFSVFQASSEDASLMVIKIGGWTCLSQVIVSDSKIICSPAVLVSEVSVVWYSHHFYSIKVLVTVKMTKTLTNIVCEREIGRERQYCEHIVCCVYLCVRETGSSLCLIDNEPTIIWRFYRHQKKKSNHISACLVSIPLVFKF